MVGTVSRLTPEFHTAYPLPWLPSSRIWQAVSAAYAALAVWELSQANVLLGLLCLVVVVATSPRLRAATRTQLGRIGPGGSSRRLS
jgi:hypothetical protein